MLTLSDRLISLVSVRRQRGAEKGAVRDLSWTPEVKAQSEIPPRYVTSTTISQSIAQRDKLLVTSRFGLILNRNATRASRN